MSTRLVQYVARRIGDKVPTKETLLEAFQREVWPVLKETRQRLNELIDLVNNGGVPRVVADLEALEALDMANAVDGQIVKVLQPNDSWQLVLEPSVSLSAATDGVNVVAPLVPSSAHPSARWVRQLIRFVPYQRVAAWFIDSATGSDRNTGITSDAPLKTLSELTTRLKGASVDQTTIVTLGAGNYGTLALDVTVAAGAALEFVGNVTVGDVQNFATITAANPATNTRPTGTIGSGAFVDGSRLRLQTGAANAGAIAYVTRVTAATTGNFTRWSTFTNIVSGVLPTLITPGGTDPFAVETLNTTIGRCQIDARGRGRVVIIDCNINSGTTDAHRINSDDASVAGAYFLRCSINNPSVNLFLACTMAFTQCRISGGSLVFARGIYLMRNTCVSSTGAGIAFQIDDNSTAQFTRSCTFDAVACFQRNAASMDLTSSVVGVDALQVVDGNAAQNYGFDVGSGCAWYQDINSAACWGPDNAYAIATFFARSAGFISYAAIPTVAGGVNDASVGGTLTAYAGLPLVNAANNASFVAAV